MPCNVCWLLADLLEEHDAGQHDDRPAHGCGKCAPVLRSQIAAEARAVMRSSDESIARSRARRDELSVLQPVSRERHLKPVVSRVAGSHANCEHESTRAARAKCRAARRKAG